MTITPLKTMLKTKVVIDFLSSNENEKIVTNPKFGYVNIIEFFKDKYNDYKENGEAWGFSNMNADILVYNIECDMEAMIKDIEMSKI